MIINPIEIRKIAINVKIDKKLSSRYIDAKKSIEIDEKFLKYQNAKKLAKDLIINEKSRYFVVVDGSFIFGDFIEALIVENNYLVKEMTISTLSLSTKSIL
jgi:deoxycytidine triphosphate deaminase